MQSDCWLKTKEFESTLAYLLHSRRFTLNNDVRLVAYVQYFRDNELMEEMLNARIRMQGVLLEWRQNNVNSCGDWIQENVSSLIRPLPMHFRHIQRCSYLLLSISFSNWLHPFFVDLSGAFDELFIFFHTKFHLQLCHSLTMLIDICQWSPLFN